MKSIEKFLDALRRLKGERSVTERAEGAWSSFCPVHEDQSPSLFIVERGEGFHVHCDGCQAPPEVIVGKVGLTKADLTGRKTKKSEIRIENAEHCEFYDYVDEKGLLLFQKIRLEKDGQKNFTIRRRVKGAWKSGRGMARVVPYHLPQLLEAERVLLVEGEKAVKAAESLGCAATCLPDGADSAWLEEYTEYFKGRTVIIVPDFDLAGRRYATTIARALFPVAKLVKVVELAGLHESEDIWDWAHRGHTREELEEQIQRARAFLAADLPRKFELSDAGNAERLIHLFGEDIRFISDWQKWAIWSGSVWERDEDGGMTRRALEMARKIAQELPLAGGAEEEKRYHSHMKASTKRAGLENAVKLAAALPSVTVSTRASALKLWPGFDGNRHLLNCANGTIDLKTGKLRESRREDFLTRRVDLPFQKDAPCPRFLRFLEEIRDGNQVEIAFLKRWFGMCLTGDVSEHRFMIFCGDGSNGKGTLANLFLDVLGRGDRGYASNANFGTFEHHERGAAPRSDIARLNGARYVTAGESSRFSRLDEAVIKQVTGGDVVTARFLHKNEDEGFKPELKLVLATNYEPRIVGKDHGIWRRVIYVPFERKFPVDAGELEEALKAEYPGILRWMVEGCLEWRERRLSIPESILKATQKYRNRQDPLSGFLEDCCVEEEAARVTQTLLYQVYRRWCGENGYADDALRKRRFEKELEGRFQRGVQNDERKWFGIRLHYDEYEGTAPAHKEPSRLFP